MGYFRKIIVWVHNSEMPAAGDEILLNLLHPYSRNGEGSVYTAKVTRIKFHDGLPQGCPQDYGVTSIETLREHIDRLSPIQDGRRVEIHFEPKDIDTYKHIHREIKTTTNIVEQAIHFARGEFFCLINLACEIEDRLEGADKKIKTKVERVRDIARSVNRNGEKLIDINIQLNDLLEEFTALGGDLLEAGWGRWVQ